MPFRPTTEGSVKVIFEDDDPVVTAGTCKELKGQNLCHPVEGLCSNAGTMRPEDVGEKEDVRPLCRERT